MRTPAGRSRLPRHYVELRSAEEGVRTEYGCGGTSSPCPVTVDRAWPVPIPDGPARTPTSRWPTRRRRLAMFLLFSRVVLPPRGVSTDEHRHHRPVAVSRLPIPSADPHREGAGIHDPLRQTTRSCACRLLLSNDAQDVGRSLQHCNYAHVNDGPWERCPVRSFHPADGAGK